MRKVLFLLISVFASLAILISGPAYAVNKDASILYVSTVGTADVGGSPLPGIVLTPAGYTNVTTVTTMDDFNAAWADRGSYDVLIFAYHAFNDATMAEWLGPEVSNLEAWVDSGGIFLGTAGRDPAELPIAAAFGLAVSNPGTGVNAVVPLEPGHPITAGIGDTIESTGSDNTPLNGEIYDEPLPAWASVVTRDSVGDVTSVAGRYGNGILWLGSGFEIQNMGSAGDAEASTFVGYRELWENFLDWATSGATAVEPASKLTSTWGAIK
jgi:hypothetical protein